MDTLDMSCAAPAAVETASPALSLVQDVSASAAASTRSNPAQKSASDIFSIPSASAEKKPAKTQEEDKLTSPSNAAAAIGKDEVLVETPTHEAFHIECDACHEWYDATTLLPPLSPSSAAQYETWHCEDCVPFHGPSQHKRSRSGLRKRKRIDFVKLNDPASLLDDENGSHIGVAANDVQEIDFKSILRQRQNRGMFKPGCDGCLLVLPLDQDQFDTKYANKHGFDRPVLIDDKTPQQIGLKVPPSNPDGTPFTFSNVAKLVGPYRPIQVIDTATQLTTEYTLQEWVDYLETPSKDRTRVLNVITLEFSQTPLGKLVTEPKFARDVDFVSLHWPKTVGEAISSLSSGDGKSSAADVLDQLQELDISKPRVSKYCLMSAGGSYTDFHVDFGGTAVWYHLYCGTKIFYFIEPTPQNLKIYSEWATNTSSSSGGAGGDGSPKKKHKKKSKKTFLPDMITASGGSVYEVVIQQGQTLFIPSGWIHAVYTPFDSLVFGGNFVHRHSLEMQLGIYRLERQMKVGKEFRFPNYQRLMWYAARDFLHQFVGDMSASQQHQQQYQQQQQQQQQHQKPQEEVADEQGHKWEQRSVQKLCKKYSPHILKGYRALAKELERWSVSKTKHIIDQYPPGMDVVEVSRQLSRITSQCTSYLDHKERDRIRRERELMAKNKRMEERARAKAKAEAKRIERLKQQQMQREEAERRRAEREMEQAVRVLERRKGLESQYEEITWAQCDRCNEWREVPAGVIQRRGAGVDDADERPFFCSEVEETCKDTATAWMQCIHCMAWHTLPKSEDIPERQKGGGFGVDILSEAGGFECETVGKKCCAKKFQRARLALTG